MLQPEVKPEVLKNGLFWAFWHQESILCETGGDFGPEVVLEVDKNVPQEVLTNVEVQPQVIKNGKE